MTEIHPGMTDEELRNEMTFKNFKALYEENIVLKLKIAQLEMEITGQQEK
jgi:hypothetical protein